LEFGTELVPAADGSLVARVVAAAELAWASFFNGLDRQTAFGGSFGPQRLSGAVSNHRPTLLYKASRAGKSKIPAWAVERFFNLKDWYHR
jgi:hypothetical protein